MRNTTSATLVLLLVCLTSGPVRAQQMPNIGATPQPSSAEAAPQDASVLTPVLLVQHRRYAVGEPILVRLGLKNGSSCSIDLFYDTPWDDFSMSIVGPDGQAVAPGLAYLGGSPSTLRPYSIAPGDVHFDGAYGQEWFPLDHWSYTLTAPGRYRITVRARARGEHTINVENEGTAGATVLVRS